MFLVNSRLGLVTAASHSREAPLLPKLRGHLAEFLRESYLAPLGILYLPTCVGFGYRCSLVASNSRNGNEAEELFLGVWHRLQVYNQF